MQQARAAEEQQVDLADVQRQLREFRTEHGRPPTADDFLKMILRPNGKGLPVSDRVAAMDAFAKTQRPSVAMSTIADLHRALRQSMEDLQMTVVLRQRAQVSGRMIQGPEETHEFAYSGRKLYLRTDEPISMTDPTRRKTVRGYDDELLRVFDQQKKDKFGTIGHFESRTSFYRAESNILFGTMLLDSRDVTGMDLPFHDLLVFIDEPNCLVFETPEMIDGRECIVIGDPGDQVWLDPRRNFAVTRFRHRMIGDDEVRLGYLCDMSEFKDCGNGLWLPQKMVRQHFAKQSGSLEREEVASVKELRANEGIPEALFHDIIPAKTLTHDAIKNLSYILGENGSIESLLDQSINLGSPPEPGRGVFLVVINVAVFVVIAATVLLWKRFKQA